MLTLASNFELNLEMISRKLSKNQFIIKDNRVLSCFEAILELELSNNVIQIVEFENNSNYMTALNTYLDTLELDPRMSFALEYAKFRYSGYPKSDNNYIFYKLKNMENILHKIDSIIFNTSNF